MFTWIPIHKEAIRKVLEYQQSQGELLAILQEMKQQGLTVISLHDKDVAGKALPLGEIDPLTFLASFNRGIREERRRENWGFLKNKWALQSPVPDDFNGIPIVHNLQSWFFPFSEHREKGHVEHLWRLAAEAATSKIEQLDEALFNRCVELKLVGIHKLTIALFWINPTDYLPADSKTTAYGRANGVTILPTNYRTYRAWMQQMAEKLGTDYPKQSHMAHLEAIKEIDHPPPPDRQFWILAAGKDGWRWSAFQAQGIISIGWDGTPDLRTLRDKEDIRRVLQKIGETDSSKKNDALACWEFVHALQKNDVVFAKQGRSRIFGYGLVEGDYIFEPNQQKHKHTRKVKWLGTGEWELPANSQMPVKTLTNITEDHDLVNSIAETVGLDLDRVEGKGAPQPPALGAAYWWLNANPTIWDLEEMPVGTRQTYKSHNTKGNKRQKYKYFHEVKPGDIVVGYVTAPQKEVVAICSVTKGLHQAADGVEEIEFEKIEQLAEPISYETLQNTPDLATSEPMVSNQGSLFKLTEPEYEIIRSLIDDKNPLPLASSPLYTKQMAMAALFLSEAQFDEILNALKEKKNVVLQGAPGVGKTFVARRIAYAFLGARDAQRVETIQFHQSYSYEDFIQGFKPTPGGHFELKYGIFHRFCRRAHRQESQQRPYVFIIDEINRGNLSKIFGELMMLIEPDKRGKEFAIPLAYSQDTDETFYIPANLYLIGMMNTADRSLAMVDYALRRRFRFITLRPEFSSNPFHEWLADAGVGSDLVKKIVSRMLALNDIIAADTKNLGPGYQIGHSYFCPVPNGVALDENWYRRVIETEIVPLIQEYWFDDERKVKEQRAALLA